MDVDEFGLPVVPRTRLGRANPGGSDASDYTRTVKAARRKDRPAFAAGNTGPHDRLSRTLNVSGKPSASSPLGKQGSSGQ